MNIFNKYSLCSDLPEETKLETKYISKFFFVFLILYFAIYVIFTAALFPVSRLIISEKVSGIIINFVSELVVPLLYILMVKFTMSLKSPAHPVMAKMTPKKFLVLMLVSIFIMNAGAYISMLFANVIGRVSGDIPQNIVDLVMAEMSCWEILLYAVVMAPVFEELLFRKLIIDKFAKYGTVFSVGVSAFVFAIIHANLYQFFYAFGVGALLGYVYCVYGNILYSIIIHSVINLVGTAVPLVLTSLNKGDASIAFFAIVFIELIMILSGGILLLCRWFKKEGMPSVDGILISPHKALYKSLGFWIFVFVFMIKLVYRAFYF